MFYFGKSLVKRVGITQDKIKYHMPAKSVCDESILNLKMFTWTTKTLLNPKTSQATARIEWTNFFRLV